MILQPRDLRIIRFINGHGAVEVGHLAREFAIDESTVGRRLRKLIGARLLHRVDTGLLSVKPIVATALGCKLARDRLPPLTGIRIGTWEHDKSVIDLELSLEAKFEAHFEPARRIRNRVRGLPHLPDGYLWRRGEKRPIAVEVESSAKAPRRLAAILKQYRTNMSLRGVLYIAGDASIARLLARFAASDPLIKIVLRDHLMQTFIEFPTTSALTQREP